MPPRLIINADDFGISAGVNRAIGELVEAGAISSATLMAGGPNFEGAVAVARAHPQLGVGCHLVFVDGMPLSPADRIRSLLTREGGSFRTSLYDFAQAALLGRVSADEVEVETIAQITRLQAAGLNVTHVDTHKHTHAFPVVARGVLRGAARCGVRRYRFPFEPQWSRRASRNASSAGRRLQLWGLQQMQQSFVEVARGVPEGFTSAGTLGIVATGSLTRDLIGALLAGVSELRGEPVLELCVHPGYVDDALRQSTTRLLDSRQTEYQALMELAKARSIGFELIHYGQTGGAPPA